MSVALVLYTWPRLAHQLSRYKKNVVSEIERNTETSSSWLFFLVGNDLMSNFPRQMCLT